MRTPDELQAAWSAHRPPRGAGTVRLLCVREDSGVHHTPEAVEITEREGIIGDRWVRRGPGKDPDGAAALTLINATVAELVAGDGLPLDAPGDNIHVDLDIGVEALPAGTRLVVGTAILRVSEQPHTGCSVFRDRFGLGALKWVSTPSGRADRLRGVNCSVIRAGTVRVGDAVTVDAPPDAARP
ncbi:MAG TPA: MOSC domain-containing protein [Acidimicrobiia bacterium]|nr:MOSC domain-containing protein [Acidimicrobiia bacterium]